jgi:hypothetical protein
MAAPSFRVLKSKTIYKGRVLELAVDRIIEPGGVKTTRELVRHPGSVVVVPHLPDRRVLLVRQFRYAARQALWELVAGFQLSFNRLLRVGFQGPWPRFERGPGKPVADT